MQIHFDGMRKDVAFIQKAMERQGDLFIYKVDNLFAFDDNAFSKGNMTGLNADFVDNFVKNYWKVPELLLWRYASGQLSTGVLGDKHKELGEEIPYPDWWLKAVGFPSGPPNPDPPKININLRNV